MDPPWLCCPCSMEIMYLHVLFSWIVPGISGQVPSQTVIWKWMSVEWGGCLLVITQSLLTILAVKIPVFSPKFRVTFLSHKKQLSSCDNKDWQPPIPPLPVSNLPAEYLLSHSSKTASVNVCRRTKMGSFGDKWVCPPVPFKNRCARLWRLRTAGSYFPEGSLYPECAKKEEHKNSQWRFCL